MPRETTPSDSPPRPVPVVLLLAKPSSRRDDVVAALDQETFDRLDAVSVAEAIPMIHEHPVDVCVCCDDGCGELDRELRTVWSRLPVVTRLVRVLPAGNERAEADVVEAPWPTGRLQNRVVEAARWAATLRENERLRRRALRRTHWITRSNHDEIRDLRESLVRAAAARDDLVLHTEAGTSFEPWARLIHEVGPRADAPFVRLDGRTLTTETFEAALAPGGRVERAEGGVVLLDHAECVAEAVLDRLRGRNPHLRIAGSRELSTQFVVAVHDVGTGGEPLRHETARSFTIPPLRTRPHDLETIATNLLDDVAAAGEAPKTLADDALAAIRSHDWPGNDDELALVLANAFHVESGTVVDESAIRTWIGSATGGTDVGDLPTLREMERRLIEATFARCDGNREQTARSLGIGIRTLSGKLREYGYPPRGGPGSNRRPLREAA